MSGEGPAVPDIDRYREEYAADLRGAAARDRPAPSPLRRRWSAIGDRSRPADERVAAIVAASPGRRHGRS